MSLDGRRAIAILRGVRPDEVVAVGDALYAAGVRDVEVPLNSPDPFRSVERLRTALAADCRVGAGTVLTAADVRRAHGAGAELIVSPNTDPRVIAATLALGMEPLPGASTPTEAFVAVEAGARTVKVFPGEVVGPAGLRAWRSVLPPDIGLVAVGGVSAETIPDWLAAGAAGVGLGSSLYRPGRTPSEVGALAERVVAVIAEFARRTA